MTFLISCPNCGPREASEFNYGGETTKRPAPGVGGAELNRYLYFRKNVTGPQTEWWYHRDGCQRWFLAERNTLSNEIARTWWPGERAS